MNLTEYETARYRKNPQKLVGTWWTGELCRRRGWHGDRPIQVNFLGEVVRVQRGIAHFSLNLGTSQGEIAVRVTVLLDTYGALIHRGHKKQIRKMFAPGTRWTIPSSVGPSFTNIIQITRANVSSYFVGTTNLMTQTEVFFSWHELLNQATAFRGQIPTPSEPEPPPPPEPEPPPPPEPQPEPVVESPTAWARLKEQDADTEPSV